MLDYFLVILSYFIGNISFSYLLTKVQLKRDIREFGSGNAGTTNVLRVLGKKAAVMVLVGDVLKGVVAVAIGSLFGSKELIAILCGLAVILGHDWPILMNFKGGKGIATSIGVFIVLDTVAALICVSIGLAIIGVKKYVSLGSVIGVAILPLIVFLLSRSREELVLAILVSTIAVFKHRSNVSRLIKGKENKLKL